MTSVPGLMITGTDTAVGKTRVAAGIVRALVLEGRRVGVLKPIATSAELQSDDTWQSADAKLLRDALGEEVPLERITPILLQGDVAPSVAMRQMNRMLDLGEILRIVKDAVDWWSARCDLLIVEGVGGLLCPITDDSCLAELAEALDYPLVIVARRGLGTLNHTLLTVEAARSRGLRTAGIVLNGAEPTTNALAEETNPIELSRLLPECPILANLRFSEIPETLSEAMHGVDWKCLARPSRLSPSMALSGLS